VFGFGIKDGTKAVIDPDFKPYERLMQCERNIMEIARAMNTHSELTQSHGRIMREMQNQIKQVQSALLEIKTQMMLQDLDREK